MGGGMFVLREVEHVGLRPGWRSVWRISVWYTRVKPQSWRICENHSMLLFEKIKIKSRCCYLVITYKFCWVWKLYKSAVHFPMANQLNFPYLSIFIAFGWCLLLGAGGRSLIRVIHVLNKASCPPATPWCHRLHAWDWAGTPAASTPRGWAASTAHSGPCRAACGAAKRVPPKGHPGASQRPLWGLMLSLLRLLLEIMAAGEVSLYKDPLLEQQLPPGGGWGGVGGSLPTQQLLLLI